MRAARLQLPLLLAVTACSITATMIPVAGPLSEQKPVPVIAVKVKNVQSNSGPFDLTMPGGARCTGRWASAAGAGVTQSALLTEYGTIAGISSSTGTGQNPGQGIATCSDGRRLQVEFVTGAGTAHGYGVAKDSDSNVYRFVF